MMKEWAKFEGSLQANYHEGYDDLNAPATDEQIKTRITILCE